MNEGTDRRGKPEDIQHGWLYRKFEGFYKTRDAIKAHPLWGTLFALLVAVLGVATNELYAYVKAKIEGPDAFLVQIRNEQKTQFSNIEKYLSEIRSGMTSGSGMAVSKLSGAVKAVEATNTLLLNQLSLAKKENEKLSRASVAKGGPLGTYSFILSTQQGIRIDPETTFGLRYVGGRYAGVSLTSSRSGKVANPDLQSGQSVAYQSAAGKKCRVSLLSIDQSAESASFAVSCSSG